MFHRRAFVTYDLLTAIAVGAAWLAVSLPLYRWGIEPFGGRAASPAAHALVLVAALAVPPAAYYLLRLVGDGAERRAARADKTAGRGRRP